MLAGNYHDHSGHSCKRQSCQRPTMPGKNLKKEKDKKTKVQKDKRTKGQKDKKGQKRPTLAGERSLFLIWKLALVIGVTQDSVS